MFYFIKTGRTCISKLPIVTLLRIKTINCNWRNTYAFWINAANYYNEYNTKSVHSTIFYLFNLVTCQTSYCCRHSPVCLCLKIWFVTQCDCFFYDFLWFVDVWGLDSPSSSKTLMIISACPSTPNKTWSKTEKNIMSQNDKHNSSNIGKKFLLSINLI